MNEIPDQLADPTATGAGQETPISWKGIRKQPGVKVKHSPLKEKPAVLLG